jgi:hypothetical protein
MRPAGGNHGTLRRYVEQVWGISTGHFDPDRVRNDALRRDPIPLSRILVKASTYSRAHCGRQNRLDSSSRKCLHCGTEFWPAYAAQRYCSRHCAVRRRRDRRARPERRKVVRPPYGHLLREVGALGYVGTGRRYGVSDNAIRKWLRQYEREQEFGDAQSDALPLE